MVHYTPLFDSEIFPTHDEETRQFISYNGRTLHVSKLETGDFQLEQLISTNPHDFLNEQFTPGTILRD